jgi:hypothetical protein
VPPTGNTARQRCVTTFRLTGLCLVSLGQPYHQKLILKTKVANQRLTDDQLVASFDLKPKTKFSMIGNPEEELITDDATKGSNDLVDDLGQ